MSETLPLATIHEAVLQFLKGRDDVVLFGAQAVNAYVQEPRMTQDIDLITTHGAALAEEIKVHLGQKFHIAVRVRTVADGNGFRIYQIRKPKNRHLVNVRSVADLPNAERIADILVMSPVALIAAKVAAYANRRGQPKSGSDWRDIAFLLLAFPELKQHSGLVSEQLQKDGADQELLHIWQTLVDQEILLEDDEFEDEDFEHFG